MSDPTEVALTYEVEQKFAEAMPTRTLLMSEANTWLRHICEQEDLDVPHLDSHALPQHVEAVAIAETWCILVNGVAPTQHTILHELAHLITFIRFGHRVEAHGKEWKQQFSELLKHFVGASFFPNDIRFQLEK
jgi:hypothetical protein